MIPKEEAFLLPIIDQSKDSPKARESDGEWHDCAMAEPLKAGKAGSQDVSKFLTSSFLKSYPCLSEFRKPQILLFSKLQHIPL